MPEIITFSHMRSYINKNLNESKNVMKSRIYNNQNLTSGQKNIFLSHSSKDKDLLPYVVRILINHGGNPYVDVGDNRLPNPPSVKTAEVLKDAINDCKRFIVFVTTNSKESSWIPWELGIGDGTKRNYDIALFPSAESKYTTNWLNQEYLGLYRKIVWGDLSGYDKKVWMVWDQVKNQATELSKWIKGN